MELYILDKNYDILSVIDEAVSVLWYPKYNDIGEGEIYIPCSEEYLELLQMGHYVYRYDDDMFCKIVNVKIETHIEQGDFIIATLQDMCTVLSGRIVRWSVSYSGKLCNYIKKLLEDNVINPQQGQRKISNFIIDESNFSELKETVDRTAYTDDLLQVVINTCKSHGYGFRVSYDINTRKLVFKLYEGLNRATETGDGYIEFSPDYANITSSHYEEDETSFKNVVYVGWKAIDETVYLLSMFEGDTEPTGEARREIYVDGTGISREITFDELKQLYGTVTKKTATVDDKVTATYYYNDTAVATSEGEGDEEKITMTDHTLLYFIRELGAQKLKETVETQSFSGEVETVSSYEYKKDYNLGDIVKVINEYGIEAEARIIQVNESEDNENGYVVEPIFEY